MTPPEFVLVVAGVLLFLVLVSSKDGTLAAASSEESFQSAEHNNSDRILLSSTIKSSNNPREYLYPKSIRTVHVRRDVHSLHPVQRGLLPFLFSDSRLRWLIDSAKGKNVTMKGLNEQKPSKMPLDKFRKTLQCRQMGLPEQARRVFCSCSSVGMANASG